MHPHIWDLGLDEVDGTCLRYKPLLLRDHPCELCNQRIYQTDRHSKCCPIIFQAAVAHSWHRAGAPDRVDSSTDVLRDVSQAAACRLLQHGPDRSSGEDRLMLRQLERHCILCQEPIINQQDWRRRLVRIHGMEVAAVPSAHHTPAVHVKKCLPLLQLLLVEQHGIERAGIRGSRPDGPSRGASTVGRAQPNECGHDEAGEQRYRAPHTKQISEARGQRGGQTDVGAELSPSQAQHRRAQSATTHVGQIHNATPWMELEERLKKLATDVPAQAAMVQHRGWSSRNGSKNWRPTCRPRRPLELHQMLARA